MKLLRNVQEMDRVDGIYITVSQHMLKLGSKRIQKELGGLYYQDFLIFMAVTLAKEFERAIDTQRYKGTKWAPLSVSYLTYKQRKNLSLNIWEATGFLKNSITIFKKFNNFIAVGFQQKQYYPNSWVQVNMVARYVEYGTNRNTVNGKKTMPARPLFRPIASYVSKHISRYYKAYLKEIGKLGNKRIPYLYLRNKSVKRSSKSRK